MIIWILETDLNSTDFDFVSEDDKVFFHHLVKDYFEESKPVFDKWRHVQMLRGEPKKHSDFFEIDDTNFIAISEKGVSLFKDTKVELLPIETDMGMYYLINVLQFINCLNKEESIYQCTKDGTIVNYSLLEFYKEKIEDVLIFKIPELPYATFLTHNFQEQCEKLGLQGLVFNAKSNLIWYSE